MQGNRFTRFVSFFMSTPKRDEEGAAGGGGEEAPKRAKGQAGASEADLATMDGWMTAEAFDYPQELCLHDLFYAQARRTPAAVAIVDGDHQYTYAEVDDLSEKLARMLVEAGAGPDKVVGIFMERSAEYVVAYVAILKAGAAYMPLELVYPAALLERAVGSTEAVAVITKAKHAPKLPGGARLFEMEKRLWLKGVSPEWHAAADALPPLAVRPVDGGPTGEGVTGPDHLAYVVMSSGTTGQPKGICCPHRGSVHSYTHRFENYPFNEDGGGRVGTGVFFVWELLRPLLRGATNVIIPDQVLFDPEVRGGETRAGSGRAEGEEVKEGQQRGDCRGFQ